MKKIYSVSYLSHDVDGSIVRSIEVVARSEKDAIKKVLDVRGSADVYGVETEKSFKIVKRY